MSSKVIKNDRKYTYEDYLSWNDGKRWEIINGVAYLMSPAPTNEHQKILVGLVRKFGDYLHGKKCDVFPAPFDVRLPCKNESSKKSSSIVQPDITIVCDPKKTKGHGCNGVPDLVIEILSPATSKRDKVLKRELYETHGVKEYWIVDPVNQLVDRFLYDETLREYKKPEVFSRDDKIIPTIFPDLEINLEEVFPEIAEYYDEEDEER